MRKYLLYLFVAAFAACQADPWTLTAYGTASQLKSVTATYQSSASGETTTSLSPGTPLQIPATATTIKINITAKPEYIYCKATYRIDGAGHDVAVYKNPVFIYNLSQKNIKVYIYSCAKPALSFTKGANAVSARLAWTDRDGNQYERDLNANADLSYFLTTAPITLNNIVVQSGYTPKYTITDTDNLDSTVRTTTGTGDYTTYYPKTTYSSVNVAISGDPVAYSISYYLNGGTTTASMPSTYTAARAVTLPASNTMSRANYTFVGWYTNEYFAGNAVSNIPKGSTGDKTFYAKWTGVDRTITTAASPPGWGTATGGGTYPYGTQTNLVATPETGRAFLRWNDSNTSTQRTITVTGNASYTAYFTNQLYTITLDRQGGTGGSDSVQVRYREKLPSIQIPSRTGYAFKGYIYPDTNINIVYDASGQPGSRYSRGGWPYPSNTTLYAQWDSTTYTITAQPYPEEGGTATGSGSYLYNDYAPLSATPNTGYSFKEWLAGVPPNAPTFSTYSNITFVVQYSATYTAVFTGNVYSVTLNANGGTIGSGDVTSYTYGTTTPLPTSADITKPGDTFGGWYTNANFLGTSFTEIPSTFIGDQEFYARWSSDGVTVTVNFSPTFFSAVYMKTNSAAVYTQFSSSFTTNLLYDTPLYLYAATKPGYSNTWYTQSSPLSTNMTANATFSPTYQANKYTVTLDPNGGSLGYTSIEKTFGSPYGNLPAPTPQYGYLFVGWYPVLEGGGQITPSTIVNTPSNHTIYAHYEGSAQPQYEVTFNANPQQGGFFVIEGDTVTVQKVSVYANEPYPSTLPQPTNLLHTFDKWVYVLNGATNDLPDIAPPSSAGVTNILAMFDVSTPFGSVINEPGTMLEYETGAFRWKDVSLDSQWSLTTQDGEACARSGDLPTGNTPESTSRSYLRTSLSSPGVLTFKWQISAPKAMRTPLASSGFWGNRMSFVDSATSMELATPIYGTGAPSAWVSCTVTNRSPSRDVEWRLEYNAGMGRGGGTAYVDQVSWTPWLSTMAIDTNSAVATPSPSVFYTRPGYDGGYSVFYPLNADTQEPILEN